MNATVSNTAFNTSLLPGHDAGFYDIQPSFPLPVPAQRPSAVRGIGRSLELIGKLIPPLATRLLWRLWFTPQRILPNHRAQELLASAEQQFEVYSGDEGVLVQSWGQGPAVLLAHGWSGYGAQLGSLVTPLVAAGFRVLLFDAPGHAANPRRQFRLDQYAQLLEDIIRHGGDVQAVVGHSIGATAAAMALHKMEKPLVFVGIAPSANLKTVLQSFQHKLGLGEKNMQRLRDALQDFFGPDAWAQYSLDFHFPHMHGAALLVHDADDAEAPAQNSVYLKSLRSNVQTFFTRGLGHNRVLHDSAVIRTITSFIAGH